MLTPIKVPGKNKRSQRRNAVTHSKDKSLRNIGRPPNTTRSSSLLGPSRSRNDSVKAQTRKSLKNIKSRRKMRKLEALPTEILEKIFLFCLNFGLPRSSPVIAGKLSSRHIFLTTTMRVLGPSWESSYIHLKNQRCSSKRHGDDSYMEGDPVLQTSLFRCRWATLSVLNKAEHTWLEKKTASKLAPMTHDSSSSRADEVNINSFDDAFLAFRSIVDDNTAQKEWRRSDFLSIHPKTEIPDTLLRGPWIDEDVMYLFWFARAGLRIDLIHSTSGEVAKQGFDRAILDGNLEVLCILQALGLDEFVDEAVLRWTAQKASGDRMAITLKVFSIMAARNPEDHSMWDDWLNMVHTAVQQRGRSVENRKREMGWAEEFSRKWLCLANTKRTVK